MDLIKAKLIITNGPEKGRTIELDQPEVSFGRDKDLVKVLLNEGSVSRKHAMLAFDNGKWTIDDIGSSNGVFVGNERIKSKTLLKNGDQVRMGNVPFLFEVEEPDGPVVGETSRIPKKAGDGEFYGTICFGDDSQQTMFGSNKAMAAFFDEIRNKAEDSKSDKTAAKDTSASDQPPASAQAAPVQVATPRYAEAAKEVARMRRRMIVLVILLLAGLIAGGNYIYQQTQREKAFRTAMNKVMSDLDNFITTSEKKVLRTSDESKVIAADLAELQRMQEEAEKTIKPFAARIARGDRAARDLSKAMNKIRFLVFSRKLRALILARKKQEAEALVKEMRDGEHAQDPIMMDLLPLAQSVMVCSIFTNEYPKSPGKSKILAPRERVEEAVRSMGGVTCGYRTNNSHLSIWCNSFGAMVKNVIDTDFPQIIIWDKFWQEADKIKQTPAGPARQALEATFKKRYPEIAMKVLK